MAHSPESPCARLAGSIVSVFREHSKTKNSKTELIERRLQAVYLQGREIVANERLGVIGKARLAFCMQRALLDSGVPSPLVNKIILAFVSNALIKKK